MRPAVWALTAVNFVAVVANIAFAAYEARHGSLLWLFNAVCALIGTASVMYTLSALARTKGAAK